MGSARTSRRRRLRFKPRQIFAIVLVVAALVFVFQNRQETRIQFLTVTFQAPLWLVLLIILAVGIIAGRFFGRQRSARAR